VNDSPAASGIDRLVEQLYVARRDGLGIEQEPAAVLDIDAALATQLAVLERFRADGRAVGGWKAALSSGNARDLLGKDFRPFGYVLADRVLRSGARVQLAGIHRCKIEPELCVVLGAPLRGSDVDAADARAAVRAIAPAFEINELRVARGLSRTLLLADGLANWGIVVGQETDVPRDLASTRVVLARGNQQLADVTPGAAMDDPFVSLARMCHVLDRFGLGLEAGQPVITGSFCHQDIDARGTYRASFSGVGSVEIVFE
jgi:2-keto-4-pentenoate hydratase